MPPPQRWPACANSPPQVVRLAILYGTQTYTSLEVATLLAQRAARRGFLPHVAAMDDFPREKLPEEKLVVFVCSTTADGEVPQTMFNFWRFLLRRGLPQGVLGDLRFAVFGLGDSSYPKYNAVARRLDVRLQYLGARPFFRMGLGDDQSELGVWGDFDAWCKDGMWDALMADHPIDTMRYTIDDSPMLRQPVRVEVFDPPASALPSAGGGAGAAGAAARVHAKHSGSAFYHSGPSFYQTVDGLPVSARLLVNQRVTSPAWVSE